MRLPDPTTSREVRYRKAKIEDALARLRAGEVPPLAMGDGPAVGGSQKSRNKLSVLLATAGQLRALELGHDMVEPEREQGGEPGTVAYCLACGLFAVTDPAEAEIPYGLAVHLECTGTYTHGPARRRSLMELEAGTRSASAEPPDGVSLPQIGTTGAA
jgi:hypothetical protein